MKVILNKCGSMRKGIERTWNFERWADQAGDFTLFRGIVSDPGFLKKMAQTQRIVHITIEEPNGFFSRNITKYEFEDFLYKTFTCCPFTAEWFNKKQGCDRRTAVFIPFNEEIIPPTIEKTVEIIYVGHPASPELNDILTNMQDFNYRNLCINRSHRSTHWGLDYSEKLRYISESKIAVVHNLLFPRLSHRDNAEKYYPGVTTENKCFVEMASGDSAWNGLLQQPLVPQLKTRTFESAFCKSLILCRRDPWNLIEKYFEPGREFIYFEPGNFKEKVQEILSDYESYLPVIEAAYERAINNYTTRHFFNKYLRDL